MIVQAIIDFFRDVIVNWLSGMSGLTGGINPAEAGAAIGGVAAQAGHVLALFVSPGVWPAIVGAWTVFLSVWVITGLVAIIARRGASS